MDALDTSNAPRAGAFRFLHAMRHGDETTTVGVLSDGFGWPDLSVPAVDELTREGAEWLARSSSQLTTVSLPLHRLAFWAHSVILGAGIRSMFHAQSRLFDSRATLPSRMMDEILQRTNDQGHLLPHVVKERILFGDLVLFGEDWWDRLRPPPSISQSWPEEINPADQPLVVARGVQYRLREAYDAIFDDVDILAMPTRPFLPPPIDSSDPAVPPFGTAVNTCIANLTGHPALSLPCGTVNGCPVGLMLMAARGRDEDLVNAAARWEAAH
jgi:Asp-tRNA(Asn)/Glu-tRNA(Gln) amidotransferase A subunit family amidase